MPRAGGGASVPAGARGWTRAARPRSAAAQAPRRLFVLFLAGKRSFEGGKGGGGGGAKERRDGGRRARREEYVKDEFVRDDNEEIEYEEDDEEEEEEEYIPSEEESDEEEDEDEGMELDLDEGPIIPGNSPQLNWVPAELSGNDSLHDLMSVITEPGSIPATDPGSIESPNPRN